MILHPKIFPWQRLGSPAMTQNLGGVAFAVPLFPSIVERVQSGPERSRARRFSARQSAPWTARTALK